jgi:glycerol-3-phosphate acyltransferase PlsY
LNEPCLLLVATALLLGNGCSIFLNFRGGKGVATTFGILLALKPALIALSAFVFLPVLYQTRTVGNASVITLGLLPLISWAVCDSFAMLLYVVCTTTLGLFWHRGNIMQLVRNNKKN